MPDSVSVTIETTTLYQADCIQCGWHTRQSSKREWIERMADTHRRTCPAPWRRNGAFMSCGCWWYAQPGSTAGVTDANCPTHGRAVMTKANAEEPLPIGAGEWRLRRA